MLPLKHTLPHNAQHVCSGTWEKADEVDSYQGASSVGFARYTLAKCMSSILGACLEVPNSQILHDLCSMAVQRRHGHGTSCKGKLAYSFRSLVCYQVSGARRHKGRHGAEEKGSLHLDLQAAGRGREPLGLA